MTTYELNISVISPKALVEKNKAKREAMKEIVKPKIEDCIKKFNLKMEENFDLIEKGNVVNFKIENSSFIKMVQEFYDSKHVPMTTEEKEYVFNELEKMIKEAGWTIVNKDKLNKDFNIMVKYEEKEIK